MLLPFSLVNFPTLEVRKPLYTFLHLLYLLKADWILGKWASEKDTPLSCKNPQRRSHKGKGNREMNNTSPMPVRIRPLLLDLTPSYSKEYVLVSLLVKIQLCLLDLWSFEFFLFRKTRTKTAAGVKAGEDSRPPYHLQATKSRWLLEPTPWKTPLKDSSCIRPDVVLRPRGHKREWSYPSPL